MSVGTAMRRLLWLPRLIGSRAWKALPAKYRLLGRFFIAHHRLPYLRHPRTFNDYVVARMFREREPARTWTCDKLAQKRRLATLDVTCAVTPTLWHGGDAARLADARIDGDWVLKPNNSGGSRHLCFGSGEPDVAEVDAMISRWRAEPGLEVSRAEWAYGLAEKTYLIERRIGARDESLDDYRVYVLRGVARFVHVTSGRRSNGSYCTGRFYDRDWRPLRVRRAETPPGPAIPAPGRLAALLHDAEVIASGFDFLRVDFYVVADVLFFGETTYYPLSGGARYLPKSFDRVLGDLIAGKPNADAEFASFREPIDVRDAPGERARA